MKLEKFKEKDNKRIGILVFTIACILLVSGAVLYRTFAIFEVKTNQNVIRGTVQDPGDIYFAIYINNELSKTMPQKNEQYYFDTESSYCGILGQSDPNIHIDFNPMTFSVNVIGIKNARTKCNLYFKKGNTLIETIQSLPRHDLNSGEIGIYEISHANENITYTTDSNAIKNLQKTELRYAGITPDNYVWFNDELWKIIGFVNTPEGQRVKIIKNESIGKYSWDSSNSNINSGEGINDWVTSDINVLLNNYYYNNKDNQKCYNNKNNTAIECGFKATGLKKVQDMIDNITWNLGANNQGAWTSIPAKDYYTMERSNFTGKQCSSSELCNDGVERNVSWKGDIGLFYMSDYIYASIGGDQINQTACLEMSPWYWYDTNVECAKNDWMFQYHEFHTMSIISFDATKLFYFTFDGRAGHYSAFGARFIAPTLYLKENILVAKGNGTLNNPYMLVQAI